MELTSFIPAGSLVKRVLAACEGKDCLTAVERQVLTGFNLRESVMTLNGPEQPSESRAADGSVERALNQCCELASQTSDISCIYTILLTCADRMTPEDVTAVTARYIPMKRTYNKVLSFFSRALLLLAHSDEFAGESSVQPIETLLKIAPTNVQLEPEKCGKYAAHAQALKTQSRFAEVSCELVEIFSDLGDIANNPLNDFSHAHFCDSNRAEYRRQLFSRLRDERNISAMNKKKLTSLAEKCGLENTELSMEAAISELVEIAQMADLSKMSNKQLLEMAEDARTRFSESCQPYLSNMEKVEAASIILRLCDECYCPIEYQLQMCSSIVEPCDDSGDSPPIKLGQEERLLWEHRKKLQKMVALRDNLPDAQIKEDFTVFCLQHKETQRQTLFAPLCETALKHSMKLCDITAIGDCLGWPTCREEIVSLVRSLLEPELPTRESASNITPFAVYIEEICSKARPTEKFEMDCQNTVIEFSVEYLRNPNAPSSPRIELCELLFRLYGEEALKELGINFTTLDIQLLCGLVKRWPALKLDEIRSPKVGDAKGLAEFVNRMLAGGSVSAYQTKALGDAVFSYQRQTKEDGFYTDAWRALFHGMIDSGGQDYIMEFRRKGIAAVCPNLLIEEHEEEIQKRLSGKNLEDFNNTSPFTESGSNVISDERARQNMEASGSFAGSLLMNTAGVSLARNYNGVIASRRFDQLRNVNPRLLSKCIRDTNGTTSSQRHEILDSSGKALLASGQIVSAALLRAEYDNAPSFLRTTAAINALNAYYYSPDDQ